MPPAAIQVFKTMWQA